MKKQHSSTDGFILKRSSNQLNNIQTNEKNGIPVRTINSRPEVSASDNKVNNLGQARPGYGMSRFAINESLSNIDDSVNQPIKKLSRRQRRRLEKRSAKRPRSFFRRIIKWLAILLLIVALAVGGYTAYKFVAAGKNVFQGSILSIFNNQPLSQDTNGRSNLLILGTSEDDPGHQAAYLTDSIMVVSIDQVNKNAYMFSVPRDLNVDYDMACSGKINEYFSCSNRGTLPADEQDRLAKTQKIIGDVFGMDIQYGVHVNYTVLEDVINAIGGSITVTIESRDPRGQMDSYFDWKCGETYAARKKNCPPNGHYIDYPNGPAVLDADHALSLALVRGHEGGGPTYGLERSNPDREINQQKILVAIRDKALSGGMLTNLGSVTKLFDALGDNLRTNIQTNEIQTIMKIASGIKSSDIHSLDLIIDGVMDGTGNPVAGNFEYSAIQDYIAKNLSGNPVVREAAPIVVLNGTETSGLGQIEADKLTTAGFNVTLVGNAPDNTYTTTEIYQIGADNNATASKLSNLFNVTIKKTLPPTTVNGDVHFVIIIGAATS